MASGYSPGGDSHGGDSPSVAHGIIPPCIALAHVNASRRAIFLLVVCGARGWKENGVSKKRQRCSSMKHRTFQFTSSAGFEHSCGALYGSVARLSVLVPNISNQSCIIPFSDNPRLLLLLSISSRNKISHTQDQAQRHENNQNMTSKEVSKEIGSGHEKTAPAPTMPIPDRACTTVHRGSSVFPRLYSTPCRRGSGGDKTSEKRHGALLNNLTPVISNSAGPFMADTHRMTSLTGPAILPRPPAPGNEPFVGPAQWGPVPMAATTSSPASVASMLCVPSANSSTTGNYNLDMLGCVENIASTAFQLGKDVDLEAPIELEPDRKLFSFQGAGQYKQRAAELSGLEALPCHRPKDPDMKQQRQYQPMLRSQHGVKEMANAQDLKAIFKAPRNANAAVASVPTLVRNQKLPQPLLSRLAREKEEEEEKDTNEEPWENRLALPYPVESQWSIPSIRLANQVHLSPGGGHFEGHFDLSERTDDKESYYSFLDDKDASLCSIGAGLEGAADPAANSVFPSLPPRLARHHAGAFDPEAPPPFLRVDDTVSTDMVPVECLRPRRRGNSPGSSGRRRKEEATAAAEWLRELRDRSPRDEAIAEAASSRFMGGSGADRSETDKVAEALGMPHPLCRSSTVAAGMGVGPAQN